jgi:hypothetical protein
MAETIFERASRRAGRRKTERVYDNVVVVHGATRFRAAADRAGVSRLSAADLVIGTEPPGKHTGTIPFDETVGRVLKDRYGSERTVREGDPCPCQSGRRFGVCHGR